jgi:aminodeoxychorismate synthase component I
VRGWILHCREVDAEVETELAFATLFGASSWAFWLDSSLVAGPARYSFLGDGAGPHADLITTRVSDADRESVFDKLDRRLADRVIDLPDGLPADAACGYVGYLGYELKANDGARTSHTSPWPDAVWLAATRFVVVDHRTGRSWVCELGRTGERARWVDEAYAVLRDLAPVMSAGTSHGTSPTKLRTELPDPARGGVDAERWLARPRDRYLADVEACLDRLRAGESYEICLTNTVELPYAGDPFATYRRLRSLNPAPYAAYLRLGDVHVLSASPERFLTVDVDRYAESRPIKGTAPRGGEPGIDATLRKELATSAKNQAENLMIVDLLRNDLGRVCVPGSIGVPEFLAVESYATVHQLVSTVRGRLRDDVTTVGALRTLFPAGSMTGAPKLRTMQIIEQVESSPRGPYAGAFGWVSADGRADLGVVIRSLVTGGDGRYLLGTGGGITVRSDVAEEYAESRWKADRLRQVFAC